MAETTEPQEEPAPQPAPTPTTLRVPPHGAWKITIYDGGGAALATAALDPGMEIMIAIEEAE